MITRATPRVMNRIVHAASMHSGSAPERLPAGGDEILSPRGIGDCLTTPAVTASATPFPDARSPTWWSPRRRPSSRPSRHRRSQGRTPLRGVSPCRDLALGGSSRTPFDLVVDFHVGPRAPSSPGRRRRRRVATLQGRSWIYTDVVARPADLRPRHSLENPWDSLPTLPPIPTAGDRTRHRVVMADPRRIRHRDRRLAGRHRPPPAWSSSRARRNPFGCGQPTTSSTWLCNSAIDRIGYHLTSVPRSGGGASSSSRRGGGACGSGRSLRAGRRIPSWSCGPVARLSGLRAETAGPCRGHVGCRERTVRPTLPVDRIPGDGGVRRRPRAARPGCRPCGLAVGTDDPVPDGIDRRSGGGGGTGAGCRIRA